MEATTRAAMGEKPPARGPAKRMSEINQNQGTSVAQCMK